MKFDKTKFESDQFNFRFASITREFLFIFDHIQKSLIQKTTNSKNRFLSLYLKRT